MSDSASTEDQAQSSADWAFVIYQRLVALATLLLVGVTWPLWIPQRRFPAVPFFEWMCPLPGLVDWVCLGLIVAAAATLAMAGPQNRWASSLWLVLSGALVATFLLNQHRFQPWAWQFCVLGLFFAWAPPSRARRLASVLALSIYFYSALSKLNHSFLVELGTDFLGVFNTMLGAPLTIRQVESWNVLALAFPLFELLTFCLLLFGRTRRLGAGAACLMHVGLLIILGPWGLNHSLGVLLWNLFFVAQAILLFGLAAEHSMGDGDRASSKRPSGSVSHRLAYLVCALVVLFPLAELLGRGDPWPAWGLYASHVGRTYCFLPRGVVERLSPELQQYVAAPSGEDLFVPVDLERWSLDQTGAPIYPGERFAWGVGRGFVAKTQTARFARFVVQSPAGRLRGERHSEAIPGERLAQESDRRFWFNTQPRDYFFAR